MYKSPKIAVLACLCLLPAISNATPSCRTGSIAESNPTTKYSDNGDGTAEDLSTGLIWKRCSEGQTWNGTSCAGSPATYTWQAALQLSANSNFAGQSDWRLPNAKELVSLVEEQCYNPAINDNLFPNTPPVKFWSSSPVTSENQQAWYVDFSLGNSSSNGKQEMYSVRLVRRSAQ